MDERAHVLNDGQWGYNGGVGYRFRFDGHVRVYGINAFVDFRNLAHASFQQFGVGVESLGEYVNLRFNGYSPFGKISKTQDVSFDRFEGNHLLLKTDYKQSMWGADGEVETEYFSYKDIDIALALGAYYFEGMKSDKSTVGGKARVTAKFYDTFYHETAVKPSPSGEGGCQ